MFQLRDTHIQGVRRRRAASLQSACEKQFCSSRDWFSANTDQSRAAIEALDAQTALTQTRDILCHHIILLCGEITGEVRDKFLRDVLGAMDAADSAETLARRNAAKFSRYLSPNQVSAVRAVIQASVDFRTAEKLAGVNPLLFREALMRSLGRLYKGITGFYSRQYGQGRSQAGRVTRRLHRAKYDLAKGKVVALLYLPPVEKWISPAHAAKAIAPTLKEFLLQEGIRYPCCEVEKTLRKTIVGWIQEDDFLNVAYLQNSIDPIVFR